MKSFLVPRSPRLGVCPTAQQGPILFLERLRPRAVARYRRRTDELAKEPLGGVGQVPSEGSDDGIVGVATAARNWSILQEAQPGASVRQPGLEPCAVAAPRARGRSRACPPRARRGEVEGGEVEAARSGALLHRRRRGPFCGWRERAIIVPEGERKARRCRRPPAASAAATLAPRSDQVEETLPPRHLLRARGLAQLLVEGLGAA
mmetsp:Transcript_20635/g.69845  ORF Transcript_20635/g.69845 Transcript_20635/m.69845 type:complete len:205 (+) Transcript_20635:89-703(+)